jgi:hypothetical protein
MRVRTRQLAIGNQNGRELEDLARFFNPIRRGWIEFYGRFHASAMTPIQRHVDLTLRSWAMRQYERFRRRKGRTDAWLQKTTKRFRRSSNLGAVEMLACLFGGSGVSRKAPARFQS